LSELYGILYSSHLPVYKTSIRNVHIILSIQSAHLDRNVVVQLTIKRIHLSIRRKQETRPLTLFAAALPENTAHNYHLHRQMSSVQAASSDFPIYYNISLIDIISIQFRKKIFIYVISSNNVLEL